MEEDIFMEDWATFQKSARTFKNVNNDEENPIYQFIGLRDNSVQTNTATEWHPISYINGLFYLS